MALAKSTEVRVGRTMERISRALAYFGGVVLAGIALTTVASVIGRALLGFGLGPIKGDFEIVEMGCAIAVFSFLPWCQLRRGHVTVDIFISRLSDRTQALLGLVGDVMLSLAAFVILWRLWLGFGEKFPFGSDGVRAIFGMGSKPFFAESTYELELPVWIPFGFSLIGATLFFLVSVYTIWRSLNWVLDGREEHV
ncbi:TRAP transporter small permease [Aliiroseovarius lamellibrachiae]|uniref:TRAP transporter small permease n=1 Tax=Aliiroseovarius lamellibrachiae TaxID=1924933 RepID=UPI001BE09BF8|nr:TRAP transporter small permease [Aliiroseovarius lamellibrachiae]MBT2132148.1 TRAP transporter small permease [Aliiroseovarius lamellibrachiae]